MAACALSTPVLLREHREPYLVQVLHDDDVSAENRHFISHPASVTSTRSSASTPEPPSPASLPLSARMPHLRGQPTVPALARSATIHPSRRMAPTRQFAASATSGPAQRVHQTHNALFHYCELHETPLDLSPVPEPLQQLNGLPKVFIGQLPREMGTQHIRWMLRDVLGVTPYDVRVAGAGCFVMQMMSQDDAHEVLSLNRRVLYDAGMTYWFARTPQQQQWLVSYADNALESLRGGRLPTNCVVVEWATERRSHRRFY